jgi:hypothetical protein
MPAYLGSGSHEVGAAKYRFIVMEKFGVDVDKLREKNKGALPEAVVYQLAWQIVSVISAVVCCVTSALYCIQIFHKKILDKQFFDRKWVKYPNWSI